MILTSLIGMTLFTASSTAPQLIAVQLAYPPAELKSGFEGIVGFEVQVAKSGRVTGCKITQTSGNANLDRQTCVQLRTTGQFKPATDSTGRPIKATYTSR